MDKFISKVKGGGSPHVFLVKGDEPYFHHRILTEVTAHYRRKGVLIEHLEGTKTSDAEIVDALETSSLFGETKFVVIRSADKIKGKVPLMTEYLKNPSENTITLFEGSGGIETPLGKMLDAYAITYISKVLNPYKKDIESWLITESSKMGYLLPEGLAKVIRNNIGESLFSLHNALRKVLMHVDGKVIDKSDLTAVLSRTATNPIFEITNAFGDRNLNKSLQLVDLFFHQDEDPSLIIVSSLLNFIEKMINAKSLLGYGLASQDAAKVLSMSPWLFQEKLSPQLKKYSIDELLEAYIQICEVDILIKGSSLDKKTIIENFLVRILGENT